MGEFMRIEKTVNGTEYVYEESLWNGGNRRLTVNGIPAGRISEKKFAMTGANGARVYYGEGESAGRNHIGDRFRQVGPGKKRVV